MTLKPKCSERSDCFRKSFHSKNSKDPAALRRKCLPVSSENRAMSPLFLLRTDGQSLRTGMYVTVSRSSLKFGASAAQRRDSVAFFFIMKMPVRTQQQQRLTFSMRARCSCCRTYHIRQDLSPCDFSLLPEVKKQLKGTLFESVEDACRAFTRAVEDMLRLT